MTVKVSSGRGRTRVTGEVNIVGRDLLVTVYGGTKPHIGAVALSIPRKSLKDKKKTSSSTSILTVTGHKDDVLAKIVAEKITSVTGRRTVVAAGIHIEKATEAEIEKIIAEAQKYADKIVEMLSSGK